eukprot:9467170-Alexandrium_andersonii.AAC.1
MARGARARPPCIILLSALHGNDSGYIFIWMHDAAQCSGKDGCEMQLDRGLMQNLGLGKEEV